MPFLVFIMAWSGEHRAFVVEEFINNGGSPITTQRAFRIRFALIRRDPVLDSKTIHNWVSNFRQTSSALKRKSTGRPRTATGLENVALHLSDRSVRRILHQELKMHPYKIAITQKRTFSKRFGNPYNIVSGPPSECSPYRCFAFYGRGRFSSFRYGKQTKLSILV